MTFQEWTERMESAYAPRISSDNAFADWGDWHVLAFGAIVSGVRSGELSEEDRRSALKFADLGYFDRKSTEALRRLLAVAPAA